MKNPRVWGPLLVLAAVAVAWWLRPVVEPVGPQRGRATIDLLLVRARLPTGELASVAVDEGQVLAVGYSPTFGGQYDPERVLEADGGTLIGGVHDHHVHFLIGGTGLDALQLAEFETVPAVQTAIREWADAHPEEPWVIGRGWGYSMFARGLPTKDVLDAIVPDRPVMLKAFDGHAQWANSVALERAGVTRATEDPPEGTIVRDEQGEPTGVFLEAAQSVIEAAAPQLTDERQREVLAQAARYVLARGVTTLDDMVYRDAHERIRLYREVFEAGQLPVRIRVFPVVPGEVSDASLDAMVALRDGLQDHPRISLPGVKVFVDGVIETKTAFLKQPYATGGGFGQLRLSGERLGRLLRACAERGLAVVLHTVGDAAVAMTLDQVEGLGSQVPPLVRLEHLEIVSPGDRERLSALGIEASMQPLHADPGGPDPEDGVWSQNLGSSRLPFGFPWKSLLDAGATLRFGSDWPVVDVNPLPGIAVAISRQDRTGQPEAGWVPEERVSLAEAMRAYDAEPDLTVGAPADLVVLRPGVRLDDPRSLWRTSAGGGGAVRWVIAHGEVHRF